MRVQSVRRERAMRWSWAIVDSVIWLLVVPVSAWLRYDLQRHAIFTPETLRFAAIAVGANLVLGAFFGPYAVGHVRGSFEEVVDVARTVALTALALVVAVFVFKVEGSPRSVPFTASAFALIAMLAARLIIRAIRTRRVARSQEEHRALVFGAGEAGRRLTRSLLRDVGSGYQPVALLDDDRAKGRLRIEGVRVRGTRADIGRLGARHQADTLIIALPLAQASTIRELTELGEDAGLKVLTLPPVKDIIDGRPTAGDLRDVDLADLLGRRPIHLDMAAIAEQIAGRRILVTGAGGSIGSELCRQLMRFGPAKLYLLDRDESGLQATQMTLDGNGLLESDTLILADIRDVEAMQAAFSRARPDIVFHAAALKHLPLLESHPLEAWRTNVLGTLNVLTAAAGVGVGTFVNISTDKAANPTCVLGYSKRLAERLTADFADRFPGRYVSVRFGNVLGSRGSVVHAFTAQIQRGGPITVTHPDVKRYFMLIPEACQLVLEAAVIGQDGEVMVLDMGEQVQIVEVAHTLIRMSGRKDVAIIYTGLRPGEKLGEELFSENEARHKTSHSLVSRVSVPSIDPDLVHLTHHTSPSDSADWMRSEASLSTASSDVVS